MSALYTEDSALIAMSYMGRLFDSRDDKNHEDRAKQIWKQYNDEIRSLESRERGQLSNYLEIKRKDLANKVSDLMTEIKSKESEIKILNQRIKENKYEDCLSPLVDKIALKERINELNEIKASDDFQEIDNYKFMIKSYAKMDKIIYKYQDYLFEQKMKSNEIVQ